VRKAKDGLLQEIIRDPNFHAGGQNIHYLHKKLGIEK
jgi:hypothetical protein